MSYNGGHNLRVCISFNWLRSTNFYAKTLLGFSQFQLRNDVQDPTCKYIVISVNYSSLSSHAFHNHVIKLHIIVSCHRAHQINLPQVIICCSSKLIISCHKSVVLLSRQLTQLLCHLTVNSLLLYFSYQLIHCSHQSMVFVICSVVH